MEAVTETEQKSDKKFVHLVAENKLILHTEVARVLFYGQWKYGRLGLIKFARLMAPLWKAYRDDDPYAEQTLLKIYKGIEKTKSNLKEYEVALQQQLNSLRGFVVDLFHHPEPFTCPIKFSTPLSFLAAMLVEHVDYVNRQLYTLKRLGLAPHQNLIPGHLMREVQEVFRLSLEWKYTGITRSDILEENQKAKVVIDLLGNLPVDIVNKEIKFTII